jgi:hypothetical protein
MPLSFLKLFAEKSLLQAAQKDPESREPKG